MNKRAFIKTSSALLAGGALAPLVSCSRREQRPARTNWAGNLTYSAAQLDMPRSVEEVSDIVKKAKKLRALGSRHCFNAIADSGYAQISLERMRAVLSLDEKGRTVTVEAGIRYGDLCPYLHEKGYALHNLASLPHISIAGACATATHGSGVSNGNLATAVSGMELVTASGEVATLSREKDGDSFAGAVVGLGGLGVVTKLTLDIQPTFEMGQRVYLNLPLESLRDDFDSIVESGYSVSLFADYQAKNVNQVWIKGKVDSGATLPAESDFFGAKPADRNVHPLIELSAVNCTEQMGTPGEWYERLPHFRMDFTPSSGTELQSEYFVPRENALAAYLALQDMGSELGPLLMISEVRTVAEDDLWMSTAYGRPTVAFHFTWKQDWGALKRLLPKIEHSLEAFGARPHWGKMFTMTPTTLETLYPKISEFRQLLNEFDPSGKFRNAYLEEYIV